MILIRPASHGGEGKQEVYVELGLGLGRAGATTLECWSWRRQTLRVSHHPNKRTELNLASSGPAR